MQICTLINWKINLIATCNFYHNKSLFTIPVQQDNFYHLFAQIRPSCVSNQSKCILIAGASIASSMTDKFKAGKEKFDDLKEGIKEDVKEFA